MTQEVSGNTRSLAPSERRQLERLFRRSVARDELVSLELVREVYSVAAQLRRRVGVLISREGHVEEVCVGTRDILYLPELGRHRLGKGRLRALRLVFSDLSDSAEATIPSDIITDLEKLRLDLVVGVKVRGVRDMLALGHLLPQVEPGTPGVRIEQVRDVGSLQFDFDDFIRGLEAELAAVEVRGADAAAAARAVLVGVYKKGDKTSESSMAELEELARTAGVAILDRIIQNRDPDPRTVLGKGKLEETILRAIRVGADMIIFDTELKPSQWRAITNSTEFKVLDRSMLILDIFAQRASSSDGRLQVELAQLKYNLPRLVEKDAGLSRLTGGIGGRGPGETKLEIGRRRTRDLIIDLEKRIDKLSEQRQMKRSRRKDNALPLVAIVGYTNVGKSTLFNAMTGADVLVENKLFATLDPTHRRVELPRLGQKAEAFILSDTVGFIRKLPEELRVAFRATLEELYDAAVILHVVDASDVDVRARKLAVETILSEMKLSATQTVVALNKVDLVAPQQAVLLAREFSALPISACTGQGLDDLQSAIASQLTLSSRGSLGTVAQP